MILKIRSVKASSKGAIQRLLEYISTDKGHITDYTRQMLTSNLYSTDLDSIQQEFTHNYDTYARKRKDGNIAHHVILSASPLDRDKLSVHSMDTIASEYLRKAYPEALAFGCHHVDQKHFHTHILVSGNNLLSPKATRQSKAQLRENHLHLLGFIKENHPELTIGIDQGKWGRSENDERTYYAKQRSAEPLDKDTLREHIQDIFRMSENTNHFYSQLQSEGFVTYQREGKPFGIHYGTDNRKMRFSRLGLSSDHFLALDKQYHRLQELEALRESLTQHRSLDR